MQYKLLDGFHVGPSPDNPAQDRMYERGEIIDSPTDLTFMNVPGYRPKFELQTARGDVLPRGSHAFDPTKESIEQFAERMKSLTIGPGMPATQQPSTNLNDMTAEQLRQHAEEEEIPVGSAKTKEQLLAAVKGKK
jgi:hypothetical protein